MRIYIRHADKLYANGCPFVDTPRHDPGIKESESEAIVKLGQFLISKYGPPSYLLCSPYLRTRQTAERLLNSLGKPNVAILIDTNLSEYLGNHRQTKMDVDLLTQAYQPPHPETYPNFRRRIGRHFRSWQPNEPVIWCITHAIVITELSRLLGACHLVNKTHPTQPLEGLVVSPSGVERYRRDKDGNFS